MAMFSRNQSFRPFARGNGAASFRSNTALSDEQMIRYAPSIFAEAPHESRSERYTQIPTALVVNGLRDAGFHPYSIAQSGSRDETKRNFTRHMIRMRRDDMAIVGDSYPEIILVNSHDGTSAYHMMFGWFRLVCSNGMVVADGPSTEIKVRHSGNQHQIVDNVIGGARQLVGAVDVQADQLETFRQTQLLPAEAEILADSAIDVRFDERPNGLTTRHVLAPRRGADTGSDLWSTVNRIQENLVRGGMSFRDAGKRRTTREVTSITQDTKINQAIWKLAQRMAEIKA